MSVSPFNFLLFKKRTPIRYDQTGRLTKNKKQALQDIKQNTWQHDLKEQAVEKMKNKKEMKLRTKRVTHRQDNRGKIKK